MNFFERLMSGHTHKHTLISRTDLGDAWPLTVDTGVLSCIGRKGVGLVTFTVDGVTYAVNGLAKQGGRWESIDAIWIDDPNIKVEPPVKKNIGPLIERGLALCR
jgi:hypothetical protein